MSNLLSGASTVILFISSSTTWTAFVLSFRACFLFLLFLTDLGALLVFTWRLLGTIFLDVAVAATSSLIVWRLEDNDEDMCASVGEGLDAKVVGMVIDVDNPPSEIFLRCWFRKLMRRPLIIVDMLLVDLSRCPEE